MRLGRREMTCAAAAALLPGVARAWTPSKDLSFVIPFAPGGGFDTYARQVIPGMSRALGGAQVLPNNAEGSAGARAANMIWRARPDGNTIGCFNIPGLFLLDGLGFDAQNLTWIGNLGRDPYGLAVAADGPIKSMDDLLALAKKRPLKFTSTGQASTGYLATKIAAELLQIPAQIISGYKGTTDYIVAAVRGDGDAAICSLTAMMGMQRSGLLRIICSFEPSTSIAGATDAARLGQPELSKVLQLRPVAGPPKLPANIRDALSDALASAMREPSVQDWARRNDANLDPLDPSATALMMREQAEFVAHWRTRLSST